MVQLRDGNKGLSGRIDGSVERLIQVKWRLKDCSTEFSEMNGGIVILLFRTNIEKFIPLFQLFKMIFYKKNIYLP